MAESKRDITKKGNWALDDCVFCQKIEAGDFMYEKFKCVVFEPLNPVTPGHLLCVPTLHVRDAADFPHVSSWAFKLAAEIVHERGIQANIITSVGPLATQSVFHCHIHVVPRRKHDGLTLPWTNQRKG